MERFRTRQHPSLVSLALLIAATSACSGRSVADASPTPFPAPFPTTAPYDGGQTACDHPYLPLKPGAYWTYERISPASLDQQEFTLSSNDFQRDSTECGGLEYGDQERQREYWVYDGMWIVEDITQGDTTNTVATLTTGAVVEMDICHYPHSTLFNCNASGISPVVSAASERPCPATNFLRVFYLYLPPVEQLVSGYSWEGDSYEPVVDRRALIDSGQRQLETYSVIGIKPVVVNGETYDGLQITKTVTRTYWSCCPPLGSCPPRTTSTHSVTYTMARGIGILQMVYSGIYSNTAIYLREYNLP